MALIRFVKPGTKTLPLTFGDTITVKRRLNTGETRESYILASTVIEDDQGNVRSVPHPLKIGPVKVAAYLVAWSLIDHAREIVPLDGLDLPQRLSVVDNLYPEEYQEIKAVIDAHETAMLAERLAEKNGQSGEMNAPAISPSPFAAAGALSGSAS